MSKKTVTMADVAADIPDPTPTPDAPVADWFIMEGVPGQGPRPDWLLPNFNNAAEQAKSYVELRKTFGAQKGAPEQYEWGELAEQLDLDNDHIKNFQVWGKENRLSNDAMTAIGKTFVEYMESRRPDPDKEIEKLGAEGIDKVKRVQNWVKNLAESPEKAHQMLSRIPVQAETIEFFDQVRQKMVHNLSRVPTQTDVPTAPIYTRQGIMAEIEQNYARYTSDPGYREQIHQKLVQLEGEE